MPYCTVDAVLKRVSSALQVPLADLPATWADLATESVRDAAADIVTILAGRGYSGSQSIASDQFAVWQERLAAYFTLGRGSALASFDLKAVEWLDPRKMLTESAALLIGGETVSPAGEQVGGLTSGSVTAVSEAGQRYDCITGRRRRIDCCPYE